jgi:Polyketide cyclase / dehydrase and lipid transport
MLSLGLHVDLDQSADRVWGLVGNFNGLPDWHPWVKASALEAVPGGIGRRVTIDGGTAGPRNLVERLVSFDGPRREYAYTIIGGPAPFVDYVGHFRLIPKGSNSCTLEFTARFRAAPGKTDAEATERIRTFYEAALAHLKTLAPSIGVT